MNRLAHALRLQGGRQGAHAHAFLGRVAYPNSVETLRKGALNRLHLLLRNNYPAHRRTLLARLDGHFFGDFFDEEVKLRGSGHGVRAQHRCIQRVRLQVKRNAKFAEAARRLEAVSGRVGSREGHDILTLHRIQ